MAEIPEIKVSLSTYLTPAEWVRSEWQILKASKTVKGLLAMEIAAMGVFVEQVVEGQQALSLTALKAWLLLQACLCIAFLFRQAWAGIESQLDGKIPPEVVKRIEDKVQTKAVDLLAEKHPEAARVLEESFEKGV